MGSMHFPSPRQHLHTGTHTVVPQILKQEKQNRKVFDAHCRRPLRAVLGIRLASEQIRPCGLLGVG